MQREGTSCSGSGKRKRGLKVREGTSCSVGGKQRRGLKVKELACLYNTILS